MRVKQKGKFSVIHLVRSVGPTSMPWNDLYGTARVLFPGMMYPVVMVQPQVGRLRLSWETNGARYRRYWQAGAFSVMALLLRFCLLRRGSEKKLILHVHNPSLAPIALLAKTIYPSILVVVTLHGEWTRFGVFQRLSLRMAALISASLVTVSEAIAETIPSPVRTRILKKGGLRAIRNGIGSAELERDYPAETLTSSRVADVVVVARMVEVKNPFFVLRCFARLKRARNLIWFGDGVLRVQLKEYARELGIEERVHWHGLQPRKQVFEALRVSSVYIACSKSEGIGVANLEAAALGARLFLSDIAPHREIAGPLGLDTFSLEDEAPWVQAMDKFLAEYEETRKRDAVELARKARVLFDLDDSVRAYMDVYREVAEHTERRGR